jgi:hypothetical protein
MNIVEKINIKILIIIFTLHFIFFLTTHSFSNKIENDNCSYKSSSIKIILNKFWNVKIDNSNIINTVNIPYFITDKNINSVIFSKIFSIPDTLAYSKVRIWILGLHGHAVIYLNERKIYEHINLSTTYYIDVEPNLLKKDKNNLEIYLYNYDKDGNSTDLRYPNYPKQFRPLGIAREIYFEFFPAKYIDNIGLKYNNQNLTLDYDIIINDSLDTKNEKTIKIEEEIHSPSGVIIFKRFEYLENKSLNKHCSRNINIKNLYLWNYESPKLYTFKLTIKSLTSEYFKYNVKFGLREVSSNGSKIFVNNTPIKIKGINYRFNFKNSFDYIKQTKTDLKTIKEIGFNTVRFINYIPHPKIAHFADSLGIYLFIDNGFWRLPSSYYSKDKYFDAGKSTIIEIAETFKNHPSVIGIGIGNEPDTNSPKVKKFIIVLEKYLNDNFNYFTYISPIDYSMVSQDALSDLLLIQNYVNPDNLFSFLHSSTKKDLPTILGNIYYPGNIYDNDNFNSNYTKIENNKLKRFFMYYDSLNSYNGYFIESFNDWYGEIPNFCSILDKNKNVIYPFGLVDFDRNKKEKFHFYANYLTNNDIKVSYYKSNQKNNFQSIIVFVMSIIFFLIYKRNFRLRENLIRSLQHPYGFFVDLRDRRIISVFNSTLMGLTVGTIVSSFLSSIIYAYYNSILFDEYINAFIPNVDIKIIFLSIIKSPWKLFLIILIFISGLQLFLVLLLKILSIFSKEKRIFRQIYSIISWSGSPLLFFIPICIFAYNFTINNIFYPEIIWIFIIFLIWFNFRLMNGLRILYLIQPAKMIVLVFLTYLFLIISFLVYINMDIELFEYLKTLSAAQNLY